MSDFFEPHPDDMPLDILGSRLDGVLWNRRSFMALCPTHRDTNRSLSVTETPDGVALIHCFADCAYTDVLAAVDLEPRHLYPSAYALISHARRKQPIGNCARPRPFSPGSGLGAENCELAEFLRDNPAMDKDVHWLARHLGLSSRSLRSLEVGFDPDLDAFLIPERNARREVVGVARRFRDGRKGFMPAGRRGLIIPSDFKFDGGEVFIVEGATDVAALFDTGSNAIGRPMAAAGDDVVAELLNMLNAEDPAICIVGDADPAGVAGAVQLAERLDQFLDGPIRCAFPARGFKDIRDQAVAGAWGLGLVGEKEVDRG